MTIDQLRQARNAAPFRSFVIHMSDGTNHLVPHPDYLWLLPAQEPAGPVFLWSTSLQIIDPDHVTRISVPVSVGKPKA